MVIHTHIDIIHTYSYHNNKFAVEFFIIYVWLWSIERGYYSEQKWSVWITIGIGDIIPLPVRGFGSIANVCIVDSL